MMERAIFKVVVVFLTASNCDIPTRRYINTCLLAHKQDKERDPPKGSPTFPKHQSKYKGILAPFSPPGGEGGGQTANLDLRENELYVCIGSILGTRRETTD